MRRSTIVAIFTLLAFSLILVAGDCDVKMKRIKLSDLDKKLKKYEGTKWDGMKKKKVKYAISGNKQVDEFSKQAGLIYASFVQADHVSNLVNRSLKALKKKKNKKKKRAAEENLKIAQEILTRAVNNAPKLVQAGQNLVNNASSLLTDVARAPEMLEAMKISLQNLYKVIEEGPALLKKLFKQSKKLAGF